jgi:hypothetical protein
MIARKKKQRCNSDSQQSNSESQQSNSDLQHNNSKSQQSDSNLQQSNSKSQQSNSDLQQSNSKSQQSNSDLQQSNSKSQQSNSDLQQSDSDLWQSDSDLWQSDSDLWQSDSDLWQSDSDLWQSDSDLWQSDSYLQQSNSNLQQHDPYERLFIARLKNLDKKYECFNLGKSVHTRVKEIIAEIEELNKFVERRKNEREQFLHKMANLNFHTEVVHFLKFYEYNDILRPDRNNQIKLEFYCKNDPDACDDPERCFHKLYHGKNCKGCELFLERQEWDMWRRDDYKKQIEQYKQEHIKRHNNDIAMYKQIIKSYVNKTVKIHML